MMGKIDLLTLTESELEEFMVGLGLPEFRVRQLLYWLYERRATSINDITVFSKSLREDMNARAYIGGFLAKTTQLSSDGTVKYLFELDDGHHIESVLIPDDKRLTLCISSQAGCAMGCKFCLTGKGGLRRNLKSHELLWQIMEVSRDISPGKLTNIVLMGMGEPLMNFDEVCEALWRMTRLMKISPRRITLSTCGVADKIEKLSKDAPPVNLAISLNATTDESRSKIMPINRRYPLNTLMEVLRRYPLQRGRRITFEYVMIRSLNDTLEDADRLARMLRKIPSKVNLIPYNEFKGSEFRPPSDDTVNAFLEKLAGSGLTAIVRKSRGSDILAACGQLSANVKAYFS